MSVSNRVNVDNRLPDPAVNYHEVRITTRNTQIRHKSVDSIILYDVTGTKFVFAINKFQSSRKSLLQLTSVEIN